MDARAEAATQTERSRSLSSADSPRFAGQQRDDLDRRENFVRRMIRLARAASATRFGHAARIAAAILRARVSPSSSRVFCQASAAQSSATGSPSIAANIKSSSHSSRAIGSTSCSSLHDLGGCDQPNGRSVHVSSSGIGRRLKHHVFVMFALVWRHSKLHDPSGILPRPAAKAAHDARVVPVFVQFRHQPTERLDDSARLDSQRHLLPSAIAFAIGRRAGDRAGEHLVPREPRRGNRSTARPRGLRQTRAGCRAVRRTCRLWSARAPAAAARRRGCATCAIAHRAVRRSATTA